MAFYFFSFALCLIPLTLAVTALQAGFRILRRLVTLRRATFSVATKRARPGDSVEAFATVVPRSARAITVGARLTCTLFDHRAHELFASERTMQPIAPGSQQYAVKVVVPTYALRTGRIGDKTANPLSERAHRMLVVWTIDFTVRSANGTQLHRRSVALDVPGGRRLKTHLRRLSLLAVDNFSATRNDMLFNWMVHLAVSDGEIAPAERELLYEFLAEMGGMTDVALAGPRLDWELQRRLVTDDAFLRRYVPLDDRLEFYRALLTLAVADGPLNEKERSFLAGSLRTFGISSDDVKPIEAEVAGGGAPEPS